MEEQKVSILLVEDDINLGYLTKDYLEILGYDVDLMDDGQKGLDAFKANRQKYSLCIFDVMLPKKDGFTLAEEIKEQDSNIPIIFLTAKDLKEDKIKGLRLGADDYITKPFSSEELGLRIEAVLRRYLNNRNGQTDKDRYTVGNYTFDYSNQQLSCGDSSRTLTKREADVLRLLCQNKNQLVRRETALQSIWGENDYFKGRSMDVYITKLRKYIKDDPSIKIINVHGTGFKLEA